MSASPADADPYRWKYRPVLVFAPDAADTKLAEQKRIVSAAGQAMRERDIVVVYIVGGDVSQSYGPGPGASASALRARYGVRGGAFSALLIGKDGGVKLKSEAPLSAERLSSIIDSMPMRQGEMGRNQR